jgi:hypothetical protein
VDIVGAFDVHRKQITFDYIEMESGEAHRGKIRPATRQSLREWLDEVTQRFSAKQIAIAVEATTGWRYVVEEIKRAGIEPHLAEFKEARSRFASEGEGDVCKPIVELPGPASVVCSDTGQTLREDRPVAVHFVAEELPDAQVKGNGNSLPWQVGWRPRILGMDPAGSHPAHWTTSCSGRGIRKDGGDVRVRSDSDEIQQFGSGQHGAGVWHERSR